MNTPLCPSSHLYTKIVYDAYLVNQSLQIFASKLPKFIKGLCYPVLEFTANYYKPNTPNTFAFVIIWIS
jgi:hypothetical protein